MALLAMVRDRTTAPVLALIVDHGIRPGSAVVARTAARAAQALGAEAQILPLSLGPGPHAHAVLRRARYQALCAAMAPLRARVLLVGHSADDQAETIWQRLATAEGWRALAGMAAHAPAPVWPEGEGIALARPLLTTNRAVLRAMLTARGIGWYDDPANQDPRFLRSRARVELAANGHTGALLSLAARMRDRLAPIDTAVAAAVSQVTANGTDLHLARTVYDALCPAAQRRLLGALLAAAGAGRWPAPGPLLRLWHAAARTNAIATLAGARVVAAATALGFSRDPGAVSGRAEVPVPQPLTLPLRTPVVWDGRIELTALVPDLWLFPPLKGQGTEGRLFDRAGAFWRLDDAAAAGLVSLRRLPLARLYHLVGLDLPAVTNLDLTGLG